jgi:hypothetical protein
MPGNNGLQEFGCSGQLAQDLVVPEAKDCIAFAVDEGRPRRLGAWLGMLTAIYLNDKPMFAANKVGDKRANRVLSGKLQALEAPVTNEIPEASLGLGCLAPQPPCARDGLCGPHGPHPALRATLSPLGRGEVGASLPLNAQPTISWLRLRWRLRRRRWMSATKASRVP